MVPYEMGLTYKTKAVKEIIDSEGNVVVKNPARGCKECYFKRNIANFVGRSQRSCVRRYRRNAYVKGYRVAGKTGTSEQR